MEEGVPAQGREIGMRWSLWSLPTQTVLGFLGSFFLFSSAPPVLCIYFFLLAYIGPCASQDSCGRFPIDIPRGPGCISLSQGIPMWTPLLLPFAQQRGPLWLCPGVFWRPFRRASAWETLCSRGRGRMVEFQLPSLEVFWRCVDVALVDMV